MKVELLKQRNQRGVMIIPETEFEQEYLAECFIGNDDRNVIVKSAVGDFCSITSINVYTPFKEV